MAMALRCDVMDACRAAGTEKPVDLAFLSAQTMGDSNLEMDILNLFVGQAGDFEKAIFETKDADDIAKLAHTLKGAAKSIGAFRLADLSAEAETCKQFDVESVIQELAAVCRYVASLQNRN